MTTANSRPDSIPVNHVNWLLQFKNRDVEAMYGSFMHNAVHQRSERLLSGMVALLDATALLRVSSMGVAGASRAMVLVNLLLALSHLMLAWWRPAIFVAWRNWIISALRLLRAVTITAIASSHGVAGLSWLAGGVDGGFLGSGLPGSSLLGGSLLGGGSESGTGACGLDGAAAEAGGAMCAVVGTTLGPLAAAATSTSSLLGLLLLSPASGLLLSAVGLPLPLALHLPVQLLTVAAALQLVPANCGVSSSSVAAALGASEVDVSAGGACALVARLSTPGAKLLRPLPLLPRRPPVSLSNVQCCQHALVLVVLVGGLVLPTLLLLVLEASSRSSFLTLLISSSAVGTAPPGGGAASRNMSGTAADGTAATAEPLQLPRSGSGANGGASPPSALPAAASPMSLLPAALAPLRMQAAASGAVLISLVPLLLDAQQAVASLQGGGAAFGPHELLYTLTALGVKCFMRLALHAAVLVVARVLLGVLSP